ncbi:MAG: hypothetical protein IKF78_02570 [Atopobiaceae bacterium]|nr:hypothetical protein [Atopobiaceae bacterium]
MKSYEKMVVLAGVVVVGITAVYRYVLSDEQRTALREVGNSLRDSTQEVRDTVAPLVSDGPTKKEIQESFEANRKRTAKQWEELGY